MRAVRRSPLARHDVLATFVHIGFRNEQAADRFLEAFEQTLTRLASQPGLGAPFDTGDPRLAGLRVCPVPRFRSYLIFYRATDEAVVVFRVLHGARGDIAGLLGEANDPA